MTDVVLIGFGVEGRAAARHFLARGDTVIAADSSAAIQPVPTEFAGAEYFRWMTEDDAVRELAPGRLILRSPGVPPRHPLVTRAVSAGLAVTTPTGHWLHNHAPPETITVTGSKGKSTTVTLIVRLLMAMGMDAAPYGNIGHPPLDAPCASAAIPVLELSSYMLHDAPPGPYFHIVTNLFREHTPWHGSEAAYHDAKLRPFRFDPPCPGLAPASVIAARDLPGAISALEDVAPLKDDQLQLASGIIRPGDIHPGFSEGPNLLALRAAVAVVIARLDRHPTVDQLNAALTDYHGLPSRQEIVPTTDGRLWINDALATIPEAVLHALRAHAGQGPITLLLGGADREQDFAALAAWLGKNESVRPIVFGSITGRLSEDLNKAGARFVTAPSYEEALEQAERTTPAGGIVLFSPSAASEAPHGNFQVRADLFRARAGLV